MAASRWLEVRCALFPRADGPGLFVPWAALQIALAQWRAEGRYEQWFFVRKPPGLRLRFAGHDLGGRLEPVLLPWLTAAEGRNDLRSFRFSVYEAEEARFGGAVGMAIAHDAFDRDSADAVLYESLPDDARRGVGRLAVSIAVTSDLLSQALEDRAEVWDVWHRLGRRIGVESVPASEIMTPADIEALATGAVPGLAALDGGLRELVRRRLDHNADVARAIVAARDAGRLEVGLRSWLCALIVFHWNRFGVTLELDDLRSAVSGLCRVLEPD